MMSIETIVILTILAQLAVAIAGGAVEVARDAIREAEFD